MSFSSSGNWNVLGQSAGVQSSLGSDDAAVWQLAISSAIIGTPLTLTASPAESPFEVEMSETICGRLPGTADPDGSPTSAWYMTSSGVGVLVCQPMPYIRRCAAEW